MDIIEYCNAKCLNGKRCRKSLNCTYHRKVDKYEDLRKRYYCDNCGANYTRKDHLRRHLADPMNCSRRHSRHIGKKVDLVNVVKKYNKDNIYEIYENKKNGLEIKEYDKYIRKIKDKDIVDISKGKSWKGFKIEYKKVLINLC